MKPKRERTKWSEAPILFVPKPRCPNCGSTCFESVRSERGGDDSESRKVSCKICEFKILLVFEPTLPPRGNCTESGF